MNSDILKLVTLLIRWIVSKLQAFKYGSKSIETSLITKERLSNPETLMCLPDFCNILGNWPTYKFFDFLFNRVLAILQEKRYN